MNSGADTKSLPIVDAESAATNATVALVGNPNAGKTSLFNRLTGLRSHTANYSGTTVERRQGQLVQAPTIGLIDLPGTYSFDATTPEERVARDVIQGAQPGAPTPDALLMVVDATNLERHLALATEVVELGLPCLVALNMNDLAERLGLSIDRQGLAERLGCEVVSVSARSGEGLERLSESIQSLVEQRPKPDAQASCGSCRGCGHAERFAWAESACAATVSGDARAPSKVSDALDRVLTHRVGGLLVFALVMFGMFMTIFSLATAPMDLIEGLFGWAGQSAAAVLPEGDLRSLLVDGLIAGVGGVVVFLPQVCLLFFLLALLEGSGYLARAALVMDRLMRRVGLPGQAFVPMLSAHACAIPAILSTRVIEDRRDRLVTILVAPLLSCSARVPVYVMVVSMLFPRDPLMASLLFAGAYALGIVAALAMAWVFQRTLLPGESKPLLIELPNYRVPSFTDALIESLHRAWDFLRNAGTTILVISLVLWLLATYPKTSLEDLPAADRNAIAELLTDGRSEAAEALLNQAGLERSALGVLGRAAQPIFAPLGFDWKTTVGVGASFAAREVIVSTLSILYGLGEEGEEGVLLSALSSAQRPDGSPQFDVATCLSLLVFFVLAMQCLPTQAVTQRETGSWKWPLFQLVYMSLLAYTAAFITYRVAGLVA